MANIPNDKTQEQTQEERELMLFIENNDTEYDIAFLDRVLFSQFINAPDTTNLYTAKDYINEVCTGFFLTLMRYTEAEGKKLVDNIKNEKNETN